MKIFHILILFTFFMNISYAETSIKYIDINYIINNSKVGTKVNSVIETKNKKFVAELEKLKQELDKKKNKISEQKNVLEDNEYIKLVKEFEKEVNTFNELKRKKNVEFNNFSIEMKKRLLNELNPIIADYLKENSISILLQKDNIIFGDKEFDITNEFLEAVNSRKIKINLKG
jgi:Skp family chaperone for outer membrane proteins